jgi:hypothetical protein
MYYYTAIPTAAAATDTTPSFQTKKEEMRGKSNEVHAKANLKTKNVDEKRLAGMYFNVSLIHWKPWEENELDERDEMNDAN